MGERSKNRLEAFFKPPGDLLERVRWIFLLSALVMATLAVPMILSRNAVGRPLQALAIAGLLWLCWWWIRGYKRANFPPPWYVLEGIAVCVAVVAIGNPLYALGLVYTGLMFRSLYGTRRSVVATLLVYLVAFCGAVAIETSLTNADISFVDALPQVPGLPLMAALLHIMTTSIERYDRATSREKILREAGAKLVSALDRESIYQATLDAALELVEDTPEARVGLATGSEEGMTVVAAAGYRAAEIKGDRFNLHTLPGPLRDRLLQKQPVEVERPESSDLRKALGLASRVRPFFVTPLLVGDELRGVIGVTSASALSEEIKEGLVALGSQASLALESNALTEEAQKRKSEERFRSLVQNASDVIMITGADGTLSYISPAVEQILGYKPEDIVGTDSFVPVHPDDAERVQNIFEEITSKPGITLAFELRLQHVDGSWRHLESSCTNLLHDPAVRGLVVNSRDVTERKRAEEALQESYGILRAVTEGTTDFIYVKDLQGRYVMVNSAAASFLGKPAQEIIGKDDSELFPPEIARDYIELDRKLIASGEAQSHEERDYVIDGETRTNAAVRGVWRDARGDAIGVFGISRDITERKRSEKKLRTSEAELRALFEAMNDLIMVFDVDGRCLKIAPTNPSNLYRPPEELLGKTFHEVFPKEQADTFLERVQRTLETRSTSTFEFNLQLDDRLGWFEATFSPMLENTVVAVARDVTERKENEEALHKSEQRFRRVVEHASDALFVHDPEGRIVDVNQRAVESLGYTREELLAMSVPDFEINFDPAALENLWEEMLPGRPVTLDGVHRRKDGTTFPVEVRVGLFESEGHQLMLALARDVTERKRTEEELRRSESELTEAQRMARVGNWSFDMTRDEGRWSDEMYRIFGFAPQEFPITYKRFLKLVHPDDKEILRRAVRAALYEDKDWYSLDYRLVRPDGEIRFLHSQYKVVRDESGRPVKLVGTSQDVTERQQAEDELRRSESRLAEAQRIARLGSWDAEPSNRTVPRMEHKMHWSDEMYRIFGFAPQEFVPTFKTLVEATHPQDREHVGRAVQGAVSRGESSLTVEHRILRPDGEVRYVQAQLEMIYDESGELQRNFGTVLDITERKRAEEELRKSEATNRAILEATPDLMFRVSRDGEYLDFRANDDSKLYVPREEIVGKNLSETMPPDLIAPMLRNIARTLDTGEMQVLEYQLPTADEVLDYEARLVVSGAEEVLAIVRDVTERKALERRLEHQAFHDTLTDLPNRALFTDRLEHALVRAGRQQEESVAVLFLDLDNFKIANDSLGHEAGDQLLVAVAERLRTYLRSQDTLARLGGDEFTILLEDIEGISDATRIAERVEEALQDPFEIKGQEVFVTASIGIALGGSDQRLPGVLLRNADLAMYQAKDTGKARYEMFDPDMNERALERLKLENELRRALENNELRVYYQPKLQLVERYSELQKYLRETNGQTIATPVALPTPRIVGAEALIRWEHPERGLVLPDQFVPIAEETGLIIPIGRWVLGEACRQARQWQERCTSDTPLTVCVNLSAKEFQQPDLADTVADILNETGLNPCSLNIEITESLLMEDTQHTIDTLQALKELGVQLSIDDFGTGYSSLAYLSRFPVDDLKIDKTFVGKLGTHYQDTALMSLTVNYAHLVGLKVVAEGVENEYQLRQLRKLGCDQAQGYYFSKPLPSQEMSAKLGLVPGSDHNSLLH